MSSQKVYLDVGGRIFVTTKLTLCSREGGSYFNRMFRSDWKESTCNGPEDAIFIDQDPDTFAMVLDYLRHGKVKVPEDKDLLWKLKVNAEYFNLNGLLAYIENFEKEEEESRIENECKLIYFSYDGAPLHCMEDRSEFSTSYQSICEYCESGSKFMSIVNSAMKDGKATDKQSCIYLNSLFISTPDDNDCYHYRHTQELAWWLKVVFFTKNVSESMDKWDFLDMLGDLGLKRAAKEFAQMNSM